MGATVRPPILIRKDTAPGVWLPWWSWCRLCQPDNRHWSWGRWETCIAHANDHVRGYHPEAIRWPS